MTQTQQIIIIGLCALGTMATRFLPFILFGGKRRTPAFVTYLGEVFPAAVFALLVVYCVRNVDFLSGLHGLPELIGIAVTAALQVWKRNMFLSIAGGTGIYMLLVWAV